MKQTSLIAFLVLILSSNLNAQFWEIGEHIQTVDYDGVILKTTNKDILSWQPSKDDISFFEKRLTEEFKPDDGSKPFDNQKRYYRGVLTTKGERRLYVDFVSKCSDSVKDGSWLKKYVREREGPIILDMSTNQFLEGITIE